MLYAANENQPARTKEITIEAQNLVGYSVRLNLATQSLSRAYPVVACTRKGMKPAAASNTAAQEASSSTGLPQKAETENRAMKSTKAQRNDLPCNSDRGVFIAT